MLDYDLAKLYQIETKALKQAVRRNLERFPDDFMFTLSQKEYNELIINIRSQFVTFDDGRGKYPKYAPFAFTELGVAMLSSVLKSDVAIAANIAIMRAFVQVREYLLAASTVSAELNELRAKVSLLQNQREDRPHLHRRPERLHRVHLPGKRPQLESPGGQVLGTVRVGVLREAAKQTAGPDRRGRWHGRRLCGLRRLRRISGSSSRCPG